MKSTPEVDYFLTAYDPSDLPGGSVDPLGFDRGYTLLADRLLPGLTNVANVPRYFSVLCAGVELAQVDDSASSRTKYERRRQAVLRLERLWALANVLVARAQGLGASGIRGVTYVAAEIERLERNGARATAGDYALLSRQEPYGVLGLFGAVAEDLRFVERKEFRLIEGSGKPLAEAFIAETDMPPAVRRVVQREGDVTLSVLASWGERAFFRAEPKKEEGRFLAEALHRNELRSRMARLLARFSRRDQETELQRMRRIADGITESSPNLDLRDALRATIAFEECYRLVVLGLERQLRLCRDTTGGLVSDAARREDTGLQRVAEQLPKAVKRLSGALDVLRGHPDPASLSRIEDVRTFLEEAAQACGDVFQVAESIRRRHQDVQHGKFDQARRRKMPWIDVVSGGVALTSAQAGGLAYSVDRPDEIQPHPYRFAAADALVAAASAQ